MGTQKKIKQKNNQKIQLHKHQIQLTPAHQFQRLATRQAFFVSASEICKLFLIKTKHTLPK